MCIFRQTDSYRAPEKRKHTTPKTCTDDNSKFVLVVLGGGKKVSSLRYRYRRPVLRASIYLRYKYHLRLGWPRKNTSATCTLSV